MTAAAAIHAVDEMWPAVANWKDPLCSYPAVHKHYSRTRPKISLSIDKTATDGCWVSREARAVFSNASANIIQKLIERPAVHVLSIDCLIQGGILE